MDYNDTLGNIHIEEMKLNSNIKTVTNLNIKNANNIIILNTDDNTYDLIIVF
jgi:hypothetical protein